MFKDVINFIQETYKTQELITLHEPMFIGNEKKYLNECIDSAFVSSVGKFVDKFEEKIHSTSDVPVQALIIDGKALDIVFHRDDPYSIDVQKMYVENLKVENVVNCNLY